MHGMRTTFRNWGGESVDTISAVRYLSIVCRTALVTRAELSYWTGDMIERRRIVLRCWADYVKPRNAKKKPSLKLVG